VLLLPVNEKLVEANLDKPATNLPFPGHKKPRSEPNWAKRLSRFHQLVNRFLFICWNGVNIRKLHPNTHSSVRSIRGCPSQRVAAGRNWICCGPGPYLTQYQPMENPRKAVGVLKKAFDILSCFRVKPEGMTLAEISIFAKINKSTCHRLLAQMEAEGFLQRENGRYQVGQALFQIGVLAPLPLALLRAAHPIMAALAREVGETINLAILDRMEILVLNVVESPHEFRMAAKVGSRRPFHVTALGKAIAAFLSEDSLESILESLPIPLARPTANSIPDLLRLRKELEEVRTRGYAIDNEEAVAGVRAVAAPVFNGAGEVTAAISVSGPTSRILPEHVPVIASHVANSADSVTASLGGDPGVSRFTMRRRGRPLDADEGKNLTDPGPHKG